VRASQKKRPEKNFATLFVRFVCLFRAFSPRAPQFRF